MRNLASAQDWRGFRTPGAGQQMHASCIAHPGVTLMQRALEKHMNKPLICAAMRTHTFVRPGILHWWLDSCGLAIYSGAVAPHDAQSS